MTKKLILSSIILIVICSSLFFIGLGKRALWDPDEPRYAQASHQMIERNDYITPYFNGKVRFDKPPLMYWCIALSYKIFGKNEFAARFPSALFALLLVLLCLFYGAVNSSLKQGLLSALILATSAEILMLSVACNTDMLLCLCIGISLVGFFCAYKSEFTKCFMLLFFYVGMALAFLTKGPVGVVLPIMIVSIFLFLKRDLKSIKKMHIFPCGIVICSVITIPWFFAMLKIHGYGYFETFFLHHNIARFASSSFQHKRPIYYHFLVLLVGFLPWSLLFLPVGVHIKQKFKQSPQKDFLLFNLIWVFTTVIFFTISQAKLPTYILPCFIAVAMLVGYFLHEFLFGAYSKICEKMTKSIYGIFCVTVFVAVFLGAFLMYKRFMFPVNTVLTIGGFLLLLWVILFATTMTKNKKKIMVAFIILILSMRVMLTFVFFPIVDKMKSTKSISLLVKDIIQKDDIVLSWGTFKPSFIYYTGHNIEEMEGTYPLVVHLAGEKRVFCLMKRSSLSELEEFTDKVVPTFYIIAKNKKYLVISNKM